MTLYLFRKCIFLFFLFKTTIVSANITEALKQVEKAEKEASSSFWPNIDHDLFFQNLKSNLTNTLHLYQGRPTNFCGFAVITYHLIKRDPDNYVRMVLELYKNGQTITPNKRTLSVSVSVQQYAGTLKNRGELDINHADQLWFMTMADNFKGYLNIFSRTYQPGAEGGMWASTNLKKFNTMLESVTGCKVDSRGSDLIRPNIHKYYSYIKDKQKDYSVMLYLNNVVFYPRKFISFSFPIPTHYVELYRMYEMGDYYVLEYWDYGLKTKVKIDKNQFGKLIYGITYIKKSK